MNYSAEKIRNIFHTFIFWKTSHGIGVNIKYYLGVIKIIKIGW